jgi:hypothetical protein
MWNEARHGMERRAVPDWNAFSSGHESKRVTVCGIEPAGSLVAMA